MRLRFVIVLILVQAFLVVQPPEIRAGLPWSECWNDFWAGWSDVDRWKQGCRRCTIHWYRDRDQPVYGLDLSTPTAMNKDQSVVVFIHGFNSRPEELRPLVEATARRGHLCTTFRYPNDQRIDESAKLLATDLKRLAVNKRAVRVALVAHSMGGLIARAMLENPELDPGNVDRLIMIATPNQGCHLAKYACSMDVLEFLTSRTRRDEASFIHGSILDGLSEATDQMRPDSAYLKRLNSRPRNPKIRYTIVLGTDGPLKPKHLDRAQRIVSIAGRRTDWARRAQREVEQKMAKLDALIEGRGDGVVSVEYGQLGGVEDVIVGPFGHNDLLLGEPDAQTSKIRDQVLSRLDG